MDNDQEEIQAGEDQENQETPEPEQDEETSSEEPESKEEGEVVVTIDDGQQQEEQPSETEWLKDLRKSWKSYKKENRQLKQELEKIKEASKPKISAQAPGPRPKLEDPGIDYDTDIYVQKIDEWHDKNRLYEDEKRRAEEQQKKEQETWQKQLNLYNEKKQNLPVKDYDDAEMVVEELLSPTQQGIIVQGAKNPELVVYALGKNPKRAKQLADIKNPVNFAFEIARLEGQLKTSKRKPATEPEKTIQSTGRISGTVDSTLEKLRRDAEKTGDYTKINAYKRKKRRSAA